MLVTVGIFIIVLAIIVVVHELGHFFTAKMMGMGIDEAGIGFPPRAWAKKAKDGITYSVNWLPLGGFVKIKGEDGEHRDDPDSFASKKIWQRAIVLVAGVVMNFLLCAVLLSVGFAVGLPQSVDQASLEQGIVEDYKIQVVSVVADRPAEEAGIELGDALLTVDGQEFKGVASLNEYTSDKIGQSLTYEFVRGEEIITKEIELVDIGSGNSGIGIGLIETGVVSYPVHKAVWNGFKLTGFLTKEITFAFGNILKNLVVGEPVGVQVSGPVGIAVLTGQVAKLGLIYILQFTALLSINLAIINFLPFPALDGGRLLFLAIEAIRRKPVNQKVEGIFHTAGFVILMLIVLIVTFQDVLRYVDFAGIFSGFFQ
jgi:regulator of sigma E protease